MISIGLAIWDYWSRAYAAPLAIGAYVDGLTSHPVYGTSAQIGDALTGNVSGLQGGEVVIHRWYDDGLIAGAPLPTYTPLPSQDLQFIRYAPTVDGVA